MLAEDYSVTIFMKIVTIAPFRWLTVNEENNKNEPKKREKKF